jgi:hypothetical protein
VGKTIMGVAAVSLDGFIADDNDDVGPLFDWLGQQTRPVFGSAAAAVVRPTPLSRLSPAARKSSRSSASGVRENRADDCLPVGALDAVTGSL